MRKKLTILTLLALFLVGCDSGSNEETIPPEAKTYTILWKNYDNTVLEIDENVPEGSLPTYDGETPTKEATENYSYAFTTWSPEVGPAVANISYVAQYESTLTAAYVTFDLNGGTTTSDYTARYISSIEAENFFFNVTKENCHFLGWEYNGTQIFDDKGNKINSVEIAESMTFKALFEINPFVTIHSNFDDAATLTGDGQYAVGSEVTVNADINEGFSLVGWYINDQLTYTGNPYVFTIGNTDVDIEAKFEKIIYTISFVTNGGESINDLSGNKGDSISVSTSKKGYTFDGWYKDSSFAEDSYFELGDTMPAYSGTLYAKWSLNEYTITYHLDDKTTNNSSNPNTYNITSETINLLDPTIDHGTFDGWFTDSEYKNQITEIPQGTTGNIDLYAKETQTIYTITFESNGMFTVSPISGTYGSKVELPNPQRDGVAFHSWCYDKQFNQYAYIKTMPDENITLYAKYSIFTYQIMYIMDENTTNNPSNPTSFSILSGTIKLLDPTVKYGTFDGWYTDPEYKNQITEINVEVLKGIALFAKVIPTVYTLSFDTNGGNSINPITGIYGALISNLPVPTKKDARFAGWYFDEELTEAANLTTMPGEDCTLYAKWVEKYQIFEFESRNYVYFGSYPQTHVLDETLKSELLKITEPNDNGYYEYNGDEYAKLQAYAHDSGYTFANGSTIVTGNTEFFKVEPILWRVISIDDSGNYTLLTDQAIDAKAYDYNGCNNYENSTIRGWINDNFFNSAFVKDEKDAIITTEVDNSAGTTDSNSNAWVCSNTNDNVFLLSYKDYFNADLGFDSDVSRYAKASDFALANNCSMRFGTFNETERNCKYYWTRSPVTGPIETVASAVFGSGSMHELIVTYGYIGVRPAINVNLSGFNK